MDSRRTSIERSATSAGTAASPSARWFGTSGSCANHQRVSWVSRAPRPGMVRESTWSNALTRSFATSRSRSSRPSGAYRSRTLPAVSEGVAGQVDAHAISSAMSRAVLRTREVGSARRPRRRRARAAATSGPRPDDGQHAPAGGDEAGPSTRRRGVVDVHVGQGVAPRRGRDRLCRARARPGSRRSPARRRRPRRPGTRGRPGPERADRGAVQQGAERRGEPRQHDLRLRVAEPGVELDHLAPTVPSTTSPQ